MGKALWGRERRVRGSIGGGIRDHLEGLGSKEEEVGMGIGNTTYDMESLSLLGRGGRGGGKKSP